MGGCIRHEGKTLHPPPETTELEPRGPGRARERGERDGERAGGRGAGVRLYAGEK